MPTDLLLALVFIAASPCAISSQIISRETAQGCKTAVEGDECHKKVMWAMQFGIRQNPEWYGSLTSLSPFQAFQQFFFDHFPDKGCAAPCPLGGISQREIGWDTTGAQFFATGVIHEASTLDENLLQASLSHEGLQMVLDSKAPAALELFVERLLESDGREVSDRSGLKSFVESTLNRTDLQRRLWEKDFETLTTQIRASGWVDGGVGRNAPLTQRGLEQATSQKSDIQTANFLLRLIDKHGKTVTDETKFARVAQIFGHPYWNWTVGEVNAMIAAGSFVSPM